MPRPELAPQPPGGGRPFHHLLATAAAEFDQLHAAHTKLLGENLQLTTRLEQAVAAGFIASQDKYEVAPEFALGPETNHLNPLISIAAASDAKALEGLGGRENFDMKLDMPPPRPVNGNGAAVAGGRPEDVGTRRVSSGSNEDQELASNRASAGLASMSSGSITLADGRSQTTPTANAPGRKNKKKSNERGLKSAFQEACAQQGKAGSDCLTAQDVYDMKVAQRRQNSRPGGATTGLPHDLVQMYMDAIMAFNRATGHGKNTRSDIGLEAYITMMQMDEDNINVLVVEEDLAYLICDMRNVLLSDNAARMFKATTTTVTTTLEPEDEAHVRVNNMLDRLDPVIGLVILANAITIGVREDYDTCTDALSCGWTWVEAIFTTIFAAEIFMKVFVLGCHGYLSGPDYLWNIFDFGVVVLAVFDLILTLVGHVAQDLSKMTIMRLLRFARLTRLVRVLRLRMFKELKLLVNGCVMGMRTLLWAVIFLAFFIYALGVFLKLTIGSEEPPDWEMCEEGTLCRRHQDHLDYNRAELFGTVPRAMFTAFRCFTGGCESMDGSAIGMDLWDTYGPVAIILYVMVVLFVLFGVFNLIAAIFVENTIESAKQDDDRRRELRDSEHVRVARKLSEVLYKVGFDEDGCIQKAEAGGRANFLKHWFLALFKRGGDQDGALTRTEHMNLKITPKVFQALLQRKEVNKMMNELDISFACRGQLFDVLDADGSGFLDVPELVQGLMKMRGGAEKSDVIAALLAVRSVQKTVKNMELIALRSQRTVEHVKRQQAEMKDNLAFMFPQLNFSSDTQDHPVRRSTPMSLDGAIAEANGR